MKIENRKANKKIMSWITKSGLAAVLVLLSFGSLATPASAQQSVRNELGFVDLDQVGGWSEFLNQDPKIDVSVEGALMKLVAEASRIEDPELADLLQKLRGVFVRGYDTSQGDMAGIRNHANQVGRDLVETGWSSVIRVRNEREHVQMFARYRGDIVIGMVVLSINEADNETMFLNIVGTIDPAQIARIGQKFNIGNVPEWD